MSNKKYSKICFLYFTFAFMSLAFPNLYSQENDECLECHSDPDLKMSKKGREISLTFNINVFNASAHSNNKCVHCHIGFNPYEEPHKKIITPVNCKACHEKALGKHFFHPNIQASQGFFPDKDVNCKGCHGNHNVSSPQKKSSEFNFANLAQSCGRCHEKEKGQFIASVHFAASEKYGKSGPNCVTCHSNPITGRYEKEKVNVRYERIKLCLSCHSKSGSAQITRSLKLIDYNNSNHGKVFLRGINEAPDCIMCHGFHNIMPPGSVQSVLKHSASPAICGKCHIEKSREYYSSPHGIALQRGDSSAPDCIYCHKEHNPWKFNIDLPINEFNQNQKNSESDNHYTVCYTCHSDSRLMKSYNIDPLMESHSWLPAAGNHLDKISCMECHSSVSGESISHNLLPLDKSLRNCEICHNKNIRLKTILNKFNKEKAEAGYGALGSAILGKANLGVGEGSNFIDVIIVLLTLILGAAVAVHGFLRHYFRKGRK